MATKIVTKNSSTASAVPTASDLVQGELAVNVADKRLFTEDNAGAIVELGTNPSTIDINAGSIDGTTIGASSASTGAFTTLTATGAFTSLGIDDNATSTAITIDSSENVGIGDSSPSVKLDVYQSTAGIGAVDFRHVNGNRILINPSYNYHDAYNHIFRGLNGTDTHMTIDNVGNVGIGTASPSSQLHISSTGATTATIEAGGGGDAVLDIKAAEASGGESIIRFSDSVSGVGFITYAQNDGGSDYMRFGTASTERMRIDASGNVGIGVAPAFPFHVQASDGALAQFSNGVDADCTIRTASGVTLITPSTGTLALGTSSTERMRIDSSGNVGIGNSSPVELLTIGSTSDTNVRALFLSSTTGAGTIQFGDGTGASAYSGYINYTHSDNALAFATGSAERARLDSSGNLLVGKTVSGQVLTKGVELSASGGVFSCTDTAADSSYFSNIATSGTRYLQRFYAGSTNVGSINSNGTATTYATSSDQRLKENIVDALSASDDIDAIQVRSFDWKADGSHQKYGMVAQELVTVAPEAVSGDADSEEMMGVDYSKLVPMLVKEIQSLRNRVAQLEE